MTPDALLDDLAADLAPRGATTGAMFGKRALKAHGKDFACLKGDLLAFRLGDSTPAHTEALALPGAELFDPSGKNRPFKDWVAIPHTHAETWPHYAETALDSLADNHQDFARRRRATPSSHQARNAATTVRV